MGSLKGILPLEGTIGALTFIKTPRGIVVREKAPANGSHPRSALQLAQTAEFSDSGRAVRLFRKAFKPLLKPAVDRYFTSRLMRQMSAVLRGDVLHPVGQRHVTDGNLALLEGIECNQNALLGGILQMPYTAIITRSTGIFEVVIAAFDPGLLLSAPEGATHFRLAAGCAAIAFSQDAVTGSSSIISASLPLSSVAAAMNLSCSIGANSPDTLFHVLGILFYKEVNGGQVLMENRAFNALAVVKVDA